MRRLLRDGLGIFGVIGGGVQHHTTLHRVVEVEREDVVNVKDAA